MEEKTKGIYKRNEGRWEARFRVGVNADGRARYRSVYAQTREEVIAKRQAAEAEILAAKTRKRPTEFNLIFNISLTLSLVIQFLVEIIVKKRPTEFNLLIIGAGTHGKDVYEIARSLHVFRKISFLDDSVQGENIIGRCSDLLKYRSQYPCAFVAIGDNKLRRRYAELLREYNFLIPSIVSQAANVSGMAQIGDGVAILPLARVGDAELGDFTIVASNGVVNSSAVLGKYCHVDCGAIVKKEARVKDGTWVKSGEILG